MSGSSIFSKQCPAQLEATISQAMSLLTKLQPVDVPQSSQPKPKQFNWALEGLRGFAAIIVALYHAIGTNNVLDPAYQPSQYLGQLLPLPALAGNPRKFHGAILNLGEFIDRNFNFT